MGFPSETTFLVTGPSTKNLESFLQPSVGCFFDVKCTSDYRIRLLVSIAQIEIFFGIDKFLWLGGDRALTVLFRKSFVGQKGVLRTSHETKDIDFGKIGQFVWIYLAHHEIVLRDTIVAAMRLQQGL